MINFSDWFNRIVQKNRIQSNHLDNNYRKDVYLDFASTTPLDNKVRQKMIDVMNIYANPGSLHGAGVHAREIIEKYRDTIARMVDTNVNKVIFTRGGTEANIIGIHGVIEQAKSKGIEKPHIITSMIEHSAVRDYLNQLKKNKTIEITYLNHDQNGYINIKELRDAIRPETVLVSIMWVNNEIGTVENIHEISKAIRWYRKKSREINKEGGLIKDSQYPLFHSDAVQAPCLYEIYMPRLGVDLLSLAASKMYGPKSTGILIMNRTCSIAPLFFQQDAHEYGMRPGTENIIGIVGASEAFMIAQGKETRESFQEKTKVLVIYLYKKVSPWIEQKCLRWYGETPEESSDHRPASHIVALGVAGISGERLVIEMSARGIMCGSRSACSTNNKGASHVLGACGYGDQDQWGTVRISFGRSTQLEDIDRFADSLDHILDKIDSEKRHLLI